MPIIITIISIILLTSCTGDTWLGGDNEEKVKGERIAVLKIESKIKPDPLLAKQSVTIPDAEYNTRWYKSSGYHVLTPQNPRAATVIKDITREDAGDWGNERYVLTATPIVAKGRIITMDGEGLVTAFDASDIDRVLWRSRIKLVEGKGNFSSGGLSYYKDKIYITVGYNIVLCLDIENGKEVWRKSINSIARSAPAVRDGRVFVSTIDNILYAMDADNGGILWTHNGIAEEIGILGNSSPLVSGNIVVVTYSSGEIYALDVKTGFDIWSDSLAIGSTDASYSLSDIDASPVLSGRNVFASSNSGVMSAIDFFSGDRVWEQEIASNGAPWVAGDYIYVLSSKYELIAVNTLSGGIKWVVQLPYYEDEEDKSGRLFWSSPVMASSRLFVVGAHGIMLAISPLDSSIINKYEIPKDIYMPIIVAHDAIFLFDNDANLIKLTGNIDITLPTVSPGNIIEDNKEAGKKDSFTEPINNLYMEDDVLIIED